MNGSTYLEKLLEEGVNTFALDEATKALGSSEQAVRQVIQRLKRSGKVASPYRKFFVIVPPEYKSNSCPPAFDFIPQLMSYLELPYYAALLSAGEYHGAALLKGKVQAPFSCRVELPLTRHKMKNQQVKCIKNLGVEEASKHRTKSTLPISPYRTKKTVPLLGSLRLKKLSKLLSYQKDTYSLFWPN